MKCRLRLLHDLAAMKVYPSSQVDNDLEIGSVGSVDGEISY